MFTTTKFLLSSLLLAVAVFALACAGGQEEEANKLVNEANEIMKKLAANEAKMTASLNDVLGEGMVSAEDLDEYRAENKAKAEALAKELEQASTDYSTAASKWDGIAPLKVDAKFKEYAALKSQEIKKRGEATKSTHTLLKAFLEEKDAEKFKALVPDYNTNFRKLVKDADDLNAKSTQMMKDNPNVFK
jgi:hypothetical protein